jgi:SAM-dependent MidA family methyltransferase
VLREKAIWLDSLPTAPMRGVILANEVMDALPCERFVVRDSKAHVLGVGLAPDGSFVWREAHKAQELAFPGPLPDGYRSETCARIASWIAGLAASLERGAILLFDYGLPRAHYYHPQRIDGTLRCHFKQRAHDDPFVNVGVQDITAWVDFTRVAEAANAAGLQVHGFTTQTAFLLGTGIDQSTERDTDDITRMKLAGEAQRLMMPGEMGEVFKAMALGRNLDVSLRGFAHQDLRASL